MKVNWPLRSLSTGHCRRFSIRLSLAAGICLAAPALLSSPARAQADCDPGNTECTIKLNQPINGASPGTSPAEDGTWLTLQIKDIGSAGVSILFAPTLSGSEYITKVGLNLTDGSSASLLDGLKAACIPASQSSGATICSSFNPDSDFVAQENGYSITGGAVDGFDLGFDFTGAGTNGGSDRLANGKSVRFDLTGSALRTADLLGAINVKGFNVNVAAKVKGIAGLEEELSGEIGDPVPVPGPLPLLGAAAAFQASRSLRRRLKVRAAVAPRSA